MTIFDEARAVAEADIAKIFDLDPKMVGMSVNGLLNFQAGERVAPQVFDEHGNLVPVEFIGAHSARPDPEQLYMNDLVWGMPKPEPWTWIEHGSACVRWISAWSGERCVAIGNTGECRITGGDFTVAWTPYGNMEFVPAPMPDRMRRG